MFTGKPWQEFSIRILLIIVILLNTFSSSSVAAQGPAPTTTSTPETTSPPTDTPTASPTSATTDTATATLPATAAESSTPTSVPPPISSTLATPATLSRSLDFARLPLSFVANLGQFDKAIKFQTNSLSGSIYFSASDVTLALIDRTIKTKTEADDAFKTKDNSKVVQIAYKNSAKSPVVMGLNLLPGVANFMVGTDKKTWVANAPTYDGILYQNLYPGIDLKYEGIENSLKSTFTVSAGTDPSMIQWSYKYAGNISVDAEGNLIIVLPAQKADQTDSTLIEHAPMAWQDQNGQRINVPVQYAITNSGQISFSFPQGYNVAVPLIIDPTLTFSTYLGGVGTDVGNAITTDSDGNVYVTGYSYCGAFPVVNPLQSSATGGEEIIIVKINASGNALRYSTCVGGSGDDMGLSIALDLQGRIIVGGTTTSTDFPIVGGIATYGGNTGMCSSSVPCQDEFLLALNTDGSAIRYSTYLGGDGREELGGVALDTSGNILVVGSTTSTNFPTVNAYDTSYATGGTNCSTTSLCYDATITKINPNLTGTNAILYSSYLGGVKSEKGLALALNSSGRVYLTGYSDSDDYPTRNAAQIVRKGGRDIILAVMDTALSGDSSLVYSTYFGSHSTDSAYGIALDSSGLVYLTGYTASVEFPLRDPFQYVSHVPSGCASQCDEAFVTKFDIATNSPIYSTFLGGSANDEGDGIALDSYGRIYVVGYTRSNDFPTFNAIQATKGADACAAPPCADAFLTVLEPDGQSLAYSTFLGGDQDDWGNGIRLDANNQVYLVGESYSANFPTTPGVYDISNTENPVKRDVFIAKIGALTTTPVTSTSFHLDARIMTGNDDAEESSSGSVNLTSSNIELVRSSTNQTIGLRFTGLNIPQGAVISEAQIQFTVATATTEATSLTFQAQASDNAPAFTTTSRNISSRTRTTASVMWTPVAWNVAEVSTPDQRTPNLASVIQEVINRPGWASGNALAIIITGTGQRIVDPYEDSVYDGAYLHVKYTIPTPTPTPTATLSPTPTKALPAGLTCTDWRDGAAHGWLQSPWVTSPAQVVWDTNGMHGSASSSGNYQVGAYFQVPAGGPYKLLFSGQHLSGLTVAQGATAPTNTGALTNIVSANSDGSYSITSAYVELTWSISAPIDWNVTPLLQTFCYSSFTPTATRTPTLTPSPTNTATPTATNTSQTQPCTVWNVATDFRTDVNNVDNHENPNRDSCGNLGVWEFMGSTTLTRDPATYYLLPNFDPNAGGYTGLNRYSSNVTFPIVYYNAGTNTVLPLNAVDIHPADNALGIIGWKSPMTGYVSVTGGVSDNNGNCGDGILWYLDKNNTNIAWGGEFNGSSQQYANGAHGASLSSIAVNTGDVLYLAIHPNGGYGCDDTRVDLIITPVNPPTFTSTPPANPTPIYQFNGLNVFVGYADNLRANSNFPIPWNGSPNTVFIGNTDTYDAGAVRLENTTDQTISVQSVTVNFPAHNMATTSFNLWGSFNIPAHNSAILTQTNGENFDTSDFGLPGVTCSQYADATYSPPTITVVLSGGASSVLTDSAHVLDTGGIDIANYCGMNESQAWQAVGVIGGANSSATLALNPVSSSQTIGASTSVVARLTDSSNQLPLSNVTVNFNVLSGPNAGQTGQATTDTQGLATFSYSGTQVGTDTIQASVTNLSGGSITSNQVTVNWIVDTLTPTSTVTATPTVTSTPSPTLTPTPTQPDFVPLEIPGWIGSPAQQATVSGVVPITLASGVTIHDGTLDYWPVNDPTHITVLATGLSASASISSLAMENSLMVNELAPIKALFTGANQQSGGSVLGTLDTTTLPNGSYVIRLSATNSDGVQQDSGVMITVTGEYKPGRVLFTITDLTIPVVGMPITIGRTYDGLERDQLGDFGNGWSLAIGNPKLEADFAHNVTLTMPDGKRVTFYFTPTPYPQEFGIFMQPHYTPEAGVYGSLEAPDCLVVLSSGKYFCFLEGDYSPTQYTYTDPYGRKFLMDADGTLKTITDLNNNVLTFAPTGITSSAGNINIPFVRDAQGRITKITYPAGKDYVYGYNASGDLDTVTFPSVTQPDNTQQDIVLHYSYYSDHFFKDATDPRNIKPVITTYDASNRVQSVTDAAGNKTTYDYDLTLRKTTIHYLGDPSTSADDLGDAILIYDAAGYLTNYTDVLGNQTIYQYDPNHNLIRVTDPLTHAVQYTYNADGHPTSIIDPSNKTLGTVDYNKYGGPTTLNTVQGGSATVQYDPVTFMPMSASDGLGSLGSYTWTTQGNPQTFSNQYGETTSYTYTAQGYVDTVTDPLGHKTHYTYDEFGRVTDMVSAYQATDGSSSTTHYVYDELGRQTQVTIAYGTSRAATTKYEYDANGNRTAVVDPLNRRTEYTYDNANRLTLVKYAVQAPAETTSTKYIYDIYGRLTDTKVAFGKADEATTHTIYDAAGRKTDVITAYGTPNASTTHYTYYADGRVQDVIIAYGVAADASTTHYVYDAAGRTTDVTTAYGTSDASTTHYTYYDSGLTKTTTTAYGTSLAATTTYFYDVRGRATVTQYPDGTSSSQNYDLTPSSPGWVNSTTDQGGVTSKSVYDQAGRLIQTIVSAYDSQGQLSQHSSGSYAYDAANRMTDSYDALNNHTSFTYYPTGQMQTSKAWKDVTTGYTTIYDYDLAGEQISVLDANSHETQYQYNERGMLKLTTYAGGVTTSQTYDFAGRLVTATDENGIVTKSTFTPAGQLSAVTMAFGTTDATTINYTYNFAGQMASMTDAKSHVTSFLYDHAGRQNKKTLPDLTYEQYTYNAAGNMTSKRLADGNTNNFTYDNMNRLTQIAYFDNTYANFTYLANGARFTSSTRATFLATPQVTQYDYDPFGRLKQVTVPDGRAVSYTYNNDDQRLSMTTPAGTINYGYNGLNQLTSVAMGTAATTFDYDPVGFMIKKTLPNGDKMVYTPNVRNQLTNITSSNSANTVLQSFAYQLDNAGNRKQVTELGGAYIKWTYDNLYRLKSEIRYNSSNAITWQASFNYDAAGNRSSQTVNSTTTNYTYNALDQLTNIGSITYGYNGRGDMTSITNGANVTTYAYNAADQLSSVTAGGTTSSYVYNADGKRVKQTIGSTVTNFLWDEGSMYGDVVYEYNNSGTALANYVLGGNQLISQTRGSTTSYFLQDGQGSTRALTNSTTGAITDTYSYTAFGESFSTTGTTVNPYRYTGQQFDTSTGLYSLRARYYNPTLGRFNSEDIYPVNFGNPVELNRYVYTENNPINGFDPTGQNDTTEYAGIIGGLVGALTFGAVTVPPLAAFASDVFLITSVYMLVAQGVGSLPVPRGGGFEGLGDAVKRSISKTIISYVGLMALLSTVVGDLVDVWVRVRERENNQHVYVDLGSGMYGYWARALKEMHPNDRVIATDIDNYYPLADNLQGTGIEVAPSSYMIDPGLADETWIVAPSPLIRHLEGREGLRITKIGGTLHMIITQDEIGNESTITDLLAQIDPSQPWEIEQIKFGALGIKSEFITSAEVVWYITTIKTP